MASRISPSSLQAFNNELVIRLQNLRECREAIAHDIVKDEARRDDLAQQLDDIKSKLDSTTQSLTKKHATKAEYDRLIDVRMFEQGPAYWTELRMLMPFVAFHGWQDTEQAYGKIVESSQTLLLALDRESESIVSRSVAHPHPGRGYVDYG
ncbi:Sjoegren syndrome nuclear autoantigen 1 [Thoreauomyces humboldtii]|nr:Sjoegren syndrome nuclear autoantigen 1 [Thoreauomyces humboldtii]